MARSNKQKKRPTRFTSVVALGMACMLLLMATCQYLFARNAEQGMENTLNARVEKTRAEQAQIVGNIYQTSRNILGNVIYDSELHKILRNTTQPDPRAIRTVRNKLRLAQSIHLNDIEQRLALLDLHGNMYTNWMRGAGFYSEIMAQPAVQEALSNGLSFFLLRHEFWYHDDENPVTRVNTLSFGNVVLDQYLSNPIGILLFSVEEDSLLRALEHDGLVAITNALNGERLCGNVDAGLYELVRSSPLAFPLGQIVQTTWEGQQMLVCRSMMAASNIELLQVMAFDEMYEDLVALRRMNVLLLLTVLGAMIPVLTILIAGISRPLRGLYQQIRHLNIQQDGTIPHITTGGYRECAEVADAINEMSERTMGMVRVINQQQKEQAELKYHLLLSQLDPHFLLNTLNNVKWTAYMSNAPRVAEMITALGFLLETSLRKNQDEVTILYEINHIRNYMLLQKMHFGNDISYDVEAEEKTLSLPSERFTLQTLVGNAIKHGYQNGVHLHIDIVIAICEECLTIAVRDDGRGMTLEHLNKVREELRASEGGKRSDHIGLRNLQQRLAYCYDGQAKMELDSIEGQGACVTLHIPLKCLQRGEAEDDVQSADRG